MDVTFDSVLDGIDGDSYGIAPLGAGSVARLQPEDTTLVIRRFSSPSGVGEVHDSVFDGDRRRLITRVICVWGRMCFRVHCEPHFGGGRDRHSTAITADGATFRSPSLTLALRTRIPLAATTRGVSAEFELLGGERATFVLLPA